jgi:HPt (histidine-containing phosphotransfer) domain-containing protein
MEREIETLRPGAKRTGGRSAVPLFDEDAQDELIDTIGNDAFFSLLTVIPEEAERHLKEIEEAVRCEDLQRARVAAHTLKGMAASCTAIRIAAAARMIEEQADANDLAAASVRSLADAIEETKDWLRQSA